jgi:hypothetical protein
MKDHTRVFLHDGGKMSVSIEEMDSAAALQRFGIAEFETAESILTWSVCKGCKSQSPVATLSAEAWKYSFASYLELCFYSRDSLLAQCGHSLFQEGYFASLTLEHGISTLVDCWHVSTSKLFTKRLWLCHPFTCPHRTPRWCSLTRRPTSSRKKRGCW